MDLRVLRYFLAVVEEGSITGAAEYLRLSQPTLSRQLKELETRLGRTLFERGSRTITLTPEGELLYERAREIVELADRAEAEVTSLAEPIAGTVHIGAGESRSMRVLAQVAKRLRHDYPRITYSLYSGESGVLAQRLEAGLLDFAIFMGPADTAKYSSVQLPLSDTWGVLMRRDSPLANRESISPEDLAGQPVIVSNPNTVALRRELAGWFEGHAHPEIVASYNLVYNASLMAREGVGYVLTYEGLVNVTSDSDLCFRPIEPRLEARHSLVWKRSRSLSRPAELFLTTLREMVER